MGIFSHDEEPMWSDVIALENKIESLEKENKKLRQQVKELESKLNAKKEK